MWTVQRRGILHVHQQHAEQHEVRGLHVEALRAHRQRAHLFLQNERDATGEFLHAYSAPFEDRFEFEFVERRGGYDLYGSTNAPVRLAALTEWRMSRDTSRSS